MNNSGLERFKKSSVVNALEVIDIFNIVTRYLLPSCLCVFVAISELGYPRPDSGHSGSAN